MSSPIALSDTQLDTVMRAAGALHVADRDPFLRAVASVLAGREIGDARRAGVAESGHGGQELWRGGASAILSVVVGTSLARLHALKP